MSEKDDIMSHSKLFIVAILIAVHIEDCFASWPLLPNLALAPASSSSIWPGMRVMPAAGLAQASLIQPIAIRDMQLAYPVQPLNIGQFSPVGAELASEHDIVQYHRNQHRRRLQRERERLRIREREREQRLRHMHRDMHLHPFASAAIRSDKNKSNNNLLNSMELSELMNKNKGSPDESNDSKQSGERMKSGSDDDFVLLQKLNNEHIKTTSRPGMFDDDLSRHRLGGQQFDMMPPDPPTKPVDIRRKTMSSPNGQVTYITEMLYDVGDMSGNSPKVTRPPVAPNFIPAPNDMLSFPPTDDPRTASPFITLVPPAANVLSRPPEITPNEWPVMPTPPTPFRARSQATEKTEQTEGSERRESNSFPTDNNSNRDRSGGTGSNFQTQNRPPHQTSRPNEFRSSSSHSPSSRQSFEQHQAKASSSSTTMTKEKTWKGSGEGLGAAAIAGIVIGSLVSITLLAGTALFVMYKSPFGKRTERIGDRRSHMSVQNVSRYTDTVSSAGSHRNDSDPKVYRWPPRRGQQPHRHHPHRTQRPAGHSSGGSGC